MQADQLRKLTRKWAIPIIVLTILGAAASYLVSHRLTPIYAATGKVQVVSAPAGSGGSGSLNINASEATATAASLMTEPQLLQQVISKLALQTTTDALSKNVSAVAESNTDLVDVTVDDASPKRAAEIANAWDAPLPDPAGQSRRGAWRRRLHRGSGSSRTLHPLVRRRQRPIGDSGC
jgi:capsular polysaccharide biosynthesis protein